RRSALVEPLPACCSVASTPALLIMIDIPSSPLAARGLRHRSLLDRVALSSRTRACGCYIMCWSFMLATGKRSTEISTTGAFPVFCHQCDVPAFSDATSPALCTIGAAQLLAYSTTSPETM